MPEGDTIFRTAVSLRRWIGGREVTAARTAGTGIDVAGLVGETVEDVEARAKHLLIRFSAGLVIHTHMQMTGSWHVYPTGERWCKPARQARLVIETGPRLAVCFAAPVVELVRAGELDTHPSLRRLGPDVLAPAAIDIGPVLARARRRAELSPTVGELLLDQQVVSGIGNIYRCETLFVCGVNPRLPSAALDADLLGRLVTSASRLMQANAATSAFSRSFDDGPDRPSVHARPWAQSRPWVYGRQGRPCRRCGTPIVRDLLGHQARSLYWCPRCQSLPASGPRR
jgi:endonuclease-8